jgi:uncharacterized protein with PQ loop repeat
MNLVHRHQVRRKKKPSGSMFRKIDALTYVITLLNLFFTLDQVRIIWIEHDAAGVSLITWGFYTLAAVVWLFYGLVHKERVIVVANTCWIVMNAIITIGALLYQ